MVKKRKDACAASRYLPHAIAFAKDNDLFTRVFIQALEKMTSVGNKGNLRLPIDEQNSEYSIPSDSWTETNGVEQGLDYRDTSVGDLGK